LEHVEHVPDLGGIEAQRLVECRRALPSRREGRMRCGGEVRAGGAVGGCGMVVAEAAWEGPTQGLGARARAERTWNMAYMLLTLDVSKLSGWLNADAPCRVERRTCDAVARCGVRAGRPEGVAAQAACARGRTDPRLGGQGTRGAHKEHGDHAVVVRDAGRVKAHRLVELRRLLPSRREGVRCGGEVRAGRRESVWAVAAQAACTEKARLKAVEVRARAERTRNMSLMRVTLEVSQLEMSALKFCK